jgi:hypothetical protein
VRTAWTALTARLVLTAWTALMVRPVWQALTVTAWTALTVRPVWQALTVRTAWTARMPTLPTLLTWYGKKLLALRLMPTLRRE